MLPYINDFPIEFRDYIASEIIPRYADFDKAHRVDHVLKVIAESLNLSQYYDVSRMMVYVIASYHDLGLCEGQGVPPSHFRKNTMGRPEVKAMVP